MPWDLFAMPNWVSPSQNQVETTHTSLRSSGDWWGRFIVALQSGTLSLHVAQTAEHGTNDAKVIGLIPRKCMNRCSMNCSG